MKEVVKTLAVRHGEKLYNLRANFYIDYNKDSDMVRVDSGSGSLVLYNNRPKLAAKGVPGRRINWEVKGGHLKDTGLEDKIIWEVEYELSKILNPLND